MAGGSVYVGTEHGRVYALDAATGTLRRSYTIAGGVLSSLAVAGGSVYIGSDDGMVYALNVER